MSTLGERIREAREQKALLQSQLAELIGAKSSAVISNWEKDLNKPDADKIVKLCRALSVSASYLLDYYGGVATEMSPPEAELVSIYRSLNSQTQELLISTARGFAGNPGMQKDESNIETA